MKYFSELIYPRTMEIEPWEINRIRKARSYLDLHINSGGAFSLYSFKFVYVSHTTLKFF